MSFGLVSRRNNGRRSVVAYSGAMTRGRSPREHGERSLGRLAQLPVHGFDRVPEDPGAETRNGVMYLEGGLSAALRGSRRAEVRSASWSH